MAINQRQSELILATLKCLKKEGFKGLSIRKIADEASVSVGLINHHFGSLDKLISLSYEYMADDILSSLQQSCEREKENPLIAMDIFIAESFNPALLDPDLLNAWIVFWAMTRHSPEIDKSHSLTYSRYLDFISRLLIDIWNKESANKYGECDIRLATISFSSMLDGLWVESCLNSTAFKSEDAIVICQRWVKSFRAGMFEISI